MSVLRPEFVRLANRLAGQRRPLRFSWNGQPTEWMLLHSPAPARGSWVIHLLLGGHVIGLEINRLPELAFLSPELAGIDLHEMPQELACGLLESCLAEIFLALGQAGVDVNITGVQPFTFRHAPEEVIGWTLNRGADIGWMHGTLSGDDAALSHLASLVTRAAAEPSIEDGAIPLPIHLVAGTLGMTLAELQTVEAGDVLLADLSRYQTGGVCTLSVSGRNLGIGHATGTAFSLQQLTPPSSSTMADVATASSINDLNVELTFVVGQTTLTVGELRNLAVGFTFELPTLTGQGISICANGKDIGRGEIIEVGGHLGVRVTELFVS
ncbi:type III secretion system cytoplasmic ring protein SctQ [Prosthecobacter dejongeii]|uniref:Type III secretion protein Q n=1 Tax=Prosthecobacter dejongeii TaxID=48465 RepID=A0A7W7YKI3_9BACT|nr:type III secretion system cytoplasmic ring protein SctQ [Prosthecobacter dejongeii]MBB5037732.1 type III secretion protein Q [Prosthecobacter dejongeii]